MSWIFAVVIGAIALTSFVIIRHGGKRFFAAPFVIENLIVTMTSGGLVFGTASWGLLKLLH